LLRLILLGAGVALGGLGAQAPEPQPPTFRADVKLVTVLATVKDARGAVIGGLGREDFTMLVEGATQEIAVFERQTDRPLSVSLLFDASGSVAKERKFEQEAALRFLRSLLSAGANPADRVAVYHFSDAVDETVRFTRSLARLEQAVLAAHPGGGTSVYDALYLAAQRLENREGRKVIVAITDGGDTTSRTTFAQSVEAAQLAEAVVYSIIVVPITNDAGRNLGGENALKTLSAATGGAAFRQYGETDLDQSFRQIERDLRTQYLLAFYPRGVAAGTQRFRRLELRVNRPGLRAITRAGYFAPPESSTSGYDPGVALPAAVPRERKTSPPAVPAGKKSAPRAATKGATP